MMENNCGLGSAKASPKVKIWHILAQEVCKRKNNLAHFFREAKTSPRSVGSRSVGFSPPARWGLLDFIRVVLLVLFSFSSFSSTTSAFTSMSTSALPTLRQALRQLPHAVATAGPQLQGSERTGHRWTSTWDLPSSVSTASKLAGPQPGNLQAQWAPLDLNLGPLRAQWAPLDLNLGPSELSEHRWTSTAR